MLDTKITHLLNELILIQLKINYYQIKPLKLLDTNGFGI